MTIRQARQDDKEDLWLIQTRAIRQQGPTHYTAEQVDAWAGGNSYRPEMYTESIDDNSVWVAECDGIVVGFTLLNKKESELRGLYVHPDFMGNGIGRLLFERLQQEAHDLGIVRLHVKASLNAAAFYERMGFVLDEIAVHNFRCGVEMPCKLMHKDLANKQDVY